MHYWPVVRGVADTRGHDLPVERRLIEIQTLIVFSPQQTSRNIIWIESLHHFTTPVTIEWIIVLLDWTNSKGIMPSKKLKNISFPFIADIITWSDVEISRKCFLSINTSSSSSWLFVLLLPSHAPTTSSSVSHTSLLQWSFFRMSD